MALTGEQWLRTHFYPAVASLPTVSASDPGSGASPLTAFAATRLLGAVDALASVGVLDHEQQERCRAAMELKGVTSERVTVNSFEFVSAIAGTAADGPGPPPVEEPDRLVRVLGDGRVFGLVGGEQAVLSCVEVWQRSVRGSFLIAASPSIASAQLDRSRQVREWLAHQQVGEGSDGIRPPMPAPVAHPGSDATWLLDFDGSPKVGAVVAGRGGSRIDWWRIDVEWPLTLGEDCRELQLSATEAGRVVGRSTLRW